MVSLSCPINMALQAAQELVEFVGGVEVSFEFARGEFFAEIFDAAREKIERGGKEILVGQDDVSPCGIRAAGEAQRIAQAGTGEGDGKAVFVEVIVEERSER